MTRGPCDSRESQLPYFLIYIHINPLELTIRQIYNKMFSPITILPYFFHLTIFPFTWHHNIEYIISENVNVKGKEIFYPKLKRQNYKYISIKASIEKREEFKFKVIFNLKFLPFRESFHSLNYSKCFTTILADIKAWWNDASLSAWKVRNPEYQNLITDLPLEILWAKARHRSSTLRGVTSWNFQN